VEEKKADYLFTVKGNQKILLSDVEDHFKLDSFFSSAKDYR
jgi:predicted transposase YbfD/YdcC